MVFSTFFSLIVRKYIFQSAKKCEVTTFYMTSLQVDLNKAAKCVDIIPLTLLASISRFRALVQNTKWQRYFFSISRRFMKVGGIKIWRELTIGVQQLVKLLLTIILSTPDFHLNTLSADLILMANIASADGPIPAFD